MNDLAILYMYTLSKLIMVKITGYHLQAALTKSIETLIHRQSKTLLIFTHLLVKVAVVARMFFAIR